MLKRSVRRMGLLLAICCVIPAQPIRPVVVSGSSMEPTFRSGRILFGSTHVGDIQRGDVIVFHHNGETMVKRVALLEGDRFPMVGYGDYWLIPGDQVALARHINTGHEWRYFQVPQGEVYVVGDNANQSVDSREYGPVPLDEIQLKVVGTTFHEPGVEFPGVQLASAPLVASR